MPEDIGLANRAKKHLSSFTIGTIMIVSYFLDNSEWIDGYLPLNGKPLALGTLLMIVVLYEFSYKRYKELKDLVLQIEKDQKVSALKAAVNGLYHRVMLSGDDYITTDYARLELSQLTDELIELNVNSYTQKKVEEMNDMVRPSKHQM